MKKIFTVFLIFIGSVAIAQTGHIQISSGPGFDVFLNGTFVGTTTKDLGGLILKDIDPGLVEIKLVKDGYGTEIKKLTIYPNRVNQLVFNSKETGIKLSQSGSAITEEARTLQGNIIIQTLPIQARIIIPDLGIESNKLKDEWKANNVPTGLYRIKVESTMGTKETELEVKPSRISQLLVDLISDDAPKIEFKPIFGETMDKRDGTKYQTVEQGSQIWLAENLRYKSADHRVVTKNRTVYTFLYTAREAQSVCPEGWRLPSESEWNLLIEFLGGSKGSSQEAFVKVANDYWGNDGSYPLLQKPTNESGMNVFPFSDFSYYKNQAAYTFGFRASFWTNTDDPYSTSPYDKSFLKYVTISDTRFAVTSGSNSEKAIWRCVRCIKAE